MYVIRLNSNIILIASLQGPGTPAVSTSFSPGVVRACLTSMYFITVLPWIFLRAAPPSVLDFWDPTENGNLISVVTDVECERSNDLGQVLFVYPCHFRGNPVVVPASQVQ